MAFETAPGGFFSDHLTISGTCGCLACFVLRHPQLEGMEGLIDQFHSIVKDFRLKRHDLLAYHNNKFDRDYVEFNVKISDLECSLQASLLLSDYPCFLGVAFVVHGRSYPPP